VSDVLSNFAAQCEATWDLHFMALDVLYPELADPEANDVLPFREGERGELVLTHLDKECQPLVRFRTGDIIEVTATDRCRCGRTGPRFRVVGRSDDMVVVRAINVFPTMVASVLNAMDALSGEYRIVLKGPGPFDRLPIEVEMKKGHDPTPELAALVEQNIRTEIHVTAKVRLLPSGSLPRTEGKTKRVIRES